MKTQRLEEVVASPQFVQQVSDDMMIATDKIMLILRGKAGDYDGKNYPKGALDEASAIAYAERRGYGAIVLDMAGLAYQGSPQVQAALAEFRGNTRVRAFFGFSAGGYNLAHVLDSLSAEELNRVELVVAIGAPDSAFRKGGWEFVRLDNPTHMDGPAALLGHWVAEKERGASN